MEISRGKLLTGNKFTERFRDQDPDAAERAMRALLDQAVRDLDLVHGSDPGAADAANGSGASAASGAAQ